MSEKHPLQLQESPAQPPNELNAPRLKNPAQVAGGLPAIQMSMRHALGEMGVARSLSTLLAVNQEGGFDCPGCAWPDPSDRSAFEFCENGAKAVAEEATRARVGPEFFAANSIEELSGWSDYDLGKAGRLTHPMIRLPGATHYIPIDWADAIHRVSVALNEISHPNAAAFYTSGRTSNEAAFLYQLFVRKFGTNNLPDCSNMCHESSGKGLSAVIGIGKGTVSLEDFERTSAIFVFGQNPGTNHPRMLTALQKAKKSGATIVTVNPLAEAGLMRFKHPQKPQDLLGSGTALTDLFLQVRLNGDVAVMKGIAKWLLEFESESGSNRSGIDHEFIAAKTTGFSEFVSDIQSTTWSEIEASSGLTSDQLRQAAHVFATSPSVIVCWAMGLTQHENGVANIQSAVNLLLLGGHFGRAGAGACPVRGHSNVQGDRTMGIWEAPSQTFLDALGREFDFQPPQEHGLAVVPAIQAMHSGDVEVFFCLGGNFLSAAPDTETTAQALRRCSMTVQVSTKLNRSHLVTGETAIILPCLGRTELDEQSSGPQFVTVENSMGIVHSSRGRLKPASELLKSEPEIVARLARGTLGDHDEINWEEMVDNYDVIRDRIARVVGGHHDYNVRVRQPNGFVLPNVVREGGFGTPDGLARFTVHPIPAHRLESGQLLMMTIRSHDQYNTTIYGKDDRYRGVYGGRRVVLMSRQDIQERGLSPLAMVRINSHHEGVTRTVSGFRVVEYDIPTGCVATYFPEANPLVPINQYAAISLTPASKSVVVTVEHQV